jgi:NAD(P)H-flavin reductase/ferredoxin
MPQLMYDGQSYALNEKETVLDGLLRHDVNAAYSCRSGACQACMMRAVQGTPSAASQHGLKETLKTQGYFLACQCIPTEDLEVGSAHIEVPAIVKNKALLNNTVMRVRLEPQEFFEFRAGQYLQLVRPDGVIRSYSIASLPGDPIELHIERVPNGTMSGWVFDELNEGVQLQIRGPVGDCFYVSGKPDHPMLLVGTATGLAPLYGIVHDALANHHKGDIHIIHGSTVRERLYYMDELKALSEHHSNIHYQACILNGEADETVTVGNIEEMVLSKSESFQNWRAYLCGNPDLVFALRKKIFLKGASNKDIFSDAFLHTKPV